MAKNQDFIYSVDVRQILKDNDIEVSSDNRNIIQKEGRPYYVSVPIDRKYSAFIPIRSHLPHNFGFTTKKGNKGKSGLDFTKSLIIESSLEVKYLKNKAIISNDEYWNIQRNQSLIVEMYTRFLFETFIPIIKKDINKLNPTEHRILTFSSLQYFEIALKSISDNFK